MKYTQDDTLPEGQYHHSKIIGLQVITTSGEIIGTVTDILSGRSNDNLIVSSTSQEILIPIIEDVIKSIKPQDGQIIIEPVDGLLDLNVKNR